MNPELDKIRLALEEIYRVNDLLRGRKGMTMAKRTAQHYFLHGYRAATGNLPPIVEICVMSGRDVHKELCDLHTKETSGSSGSSPSQSSSQS